MDDDFDYCPICLKPCSTELIECGSWQFPDERGLGSLSACCGAGWFLTADEARRERVAKLVEPFPLYVEAL